MPSLPGRLKLLGWLSRAARLEALDAALEVGSTTERRAIVAQIAEEHRGSDRAAALETMVRRWGRELDREIRDEVMAVLRSMDRAALEGVLGEMLLADAGDAEARVAAAGVAGTLPATGLAERLVGMLGDVAAGEAAEGALEAMTGWLIAGRAAGRAVGAGLVGEAIAQGVERVREHRRAGVARCLCRLAEARFRLRAVDGAGTDGAAWINDAEHPAGAALRRLIRSDGSASVTAAAWAWVRVPALTGACVDRLMKEPGAALAAAVARPQLMLNPARRRALAGQRGSAGRMLPDAAGVARLEAAGRVAAAGLIALLPAPARERDAALGAFLTESDAGVRHAAARAAGTMALAGPTPALLDLCFDADARVARTATLAALGRLPRRGEERGGAVMASLARLARSAHGTARGAARGLGMVEAGEGAAWEIDHPAARGRIARERMREGGERAIAERIAAAVEGGGDEGVRAVTAARRLGLSGMVGAVLGAAVTAYLRGVGLEDERLACAATAALGDLRDGASEGVLRRCLGAASARLRANAADAVHRRWRRTAVLSAEADGLLRGMCVDAEHRPRASAARALLGASGAVGPRMSTARDEGERTLVAMLGDERPMHRAAGLWLAERAASRVAPLPEVVDAVASLARVAKGEERVRARRAAERLVIEVRAGWTGRASMLGSGDGETGAAGSAEEAVA